MANPRIPVTPALRMLRAHKAEFTPLLYPYEEKGGTARSSALLGLPEHQVIKTLVTCAAKGQYWMVLMHGDQEVSLRGLSRHLGLKSSVTMCDPKEVLRVTGYQTGGVSPFGVKRPLPVFAQPSIFELPWVAINGGKRGFLVRIEPRVIQEILAPTALDLAT